MVESLTKDKERDKDRSKDKERDKDKSRDKPRDDRERDTKDRDRERDRDRDSKHKKDDKSRSEKDRDRSRDKDREKDRDRKDHRDREKPRDTRDNRERDNPRVKEEEEEHGGNKGSSSSENSISVEETNRIRAQLGLAPLKIDTGPTKEELAKQQQEREEMEKEAKTMELADRLEKMRNKRLLTQKMAGKSIAEEAKEEDDDPLAWIEKSRKIEAEKALAAAKMKEMDEQEEEQEQERAHAYTEKNLAGIKIAHNAEHFNENEEILVLKDAYIVGQDGLNEEEDELESVHISEATRRKKNADAAKKKPLYDVYGDDGDTVDLLPQYNEEKKESGVVLGSGGEVDLAKQQQLEEVRKKLSAVKQEQYSLETPVHLTPMADYYTAEEMTQFKQPQRRKKKKSTRKKEENLADIIAATVPSSEAGSGDHGSRATRSEGPLEQKLKMEKDIKAQNYQKALAKASEESKVLYSADIDEEEDFYASLKSNTRPQSLEAVAEAVSARSKKRQQDEAENGIDAPIIEYEEDEDGEGKPKGPLVMSSTSEFVRNIQVEREERRRVKTEATVTETLKSVKEEKKDVDMEDGEKEESEDEGRADDALDEPLVSGGLAATLAFLKQKGDTLPFEAHVGRANDKVVSSKGDPAPNISNLAHGIISYYFFDVTQIRLEYLDENGRPMTQKEAFRHQSYKFHGKQPGKNNKEKRMKQLEREQRRLGASSTDTPLKTVQAMQEAQKKTGSAYVVLQSGSMSLAARAESGDASTTQDATQGKRKGAAGSGAQGKDKRSKS